MNWTRIIHEFIVALFNDEETDEFEVIEAFDISHQSSCLTKGEQAINVALLFLLHNAGNSLTQQVTIVAHLPAILCLTIHLSAKF